MPSPTLDDVYEALTSLRAPLQRGEYDLHRLVCAALTEADIPWQHEVTLAPHCRIDLRCGRIGIECKRGKPERARLLAQLTRYAASPSIDGLIVVCERYVALPSSIGGKPLRLLCLNRLWGIAL